MTRPVAASGLPTFMMPCPHCGQRMSVKSVTPTLFAPELDDITHACDQCGSELVRTVKAATPMPHDANSDSSRAA
jgi:predicted RNA-binding Zn-ribbon protein involved in translation (DUF1610 family)